MVDGIRSFRSAIRSLRRSPGFVATAVLTLALGIGLSVAVFTVAEALLLRRLPVRDADRLVALWGQPADRSLANYPLRLSDAREFVRRTRSLERVGFFAYEGAWPTPIRDGDRIYQLRRALVSGDFLDVLGARPVVGRILRPADDVVGAAPVVVLSHGVWQREFGGTAQALGRQIVLFGDGVAYTVVGVMPQGVDYPRGADFWAPLLPARDSTVDDIEMIGRLRPGVTPSVAGDELTAFYRRPEASAWSRNFRAVVTPFSQLILGDTKPAVVVFAVAAALLLLITCVNVANLLLVRGLARAREITVRSALGAGRGRLVAHLLTENGILAVIGGGLGIAVAAGAVRLFLGFVPTGLPRVDEIRVNGAALLGALGITVAALLLFGIAPAVLTSRVDLQQALRAGGRHGAGRGSRLLAEGLVAGQIALATLILSAAGLLGRSLIRLQTANLSLESSHLLIGELAFRLDRADSYPKQLALLDRVLAAAAAVPGVKGVSPTVAMPFAGTGGWDGSLTTEGQSPEEAAKNPVMNLEVMTPNYFTTLGMPVVRGRGFTDEDREGNSIVVVVSQSAARLYWPGADPLGKRLGMSAKPEWVATVVGVVPDTRYRDLRAARPSVYFPLRQSFFRYAPTNLAIRTAGAPGDLVPAIRRAIDAVDPGVALTSAASFDRFLDGPLAQPRVNALLLALFAGAAVVLAAIGLFGVMATMVGQRSREFGVRMALGASGGAVRGIVLRRSLAIAGAGLLVGLLGALGGSGLLRSLLYGVSPTDPVTLVVGGLVLLGVIMLAGLIPARAGTRIDPMIALRAEE